MSDILILVKVGFSLQKPRGDREVTDDEARSSGEDGASGNTGKAQECARLSPDCDRKGETKLGIAGT